MIRIGDSLIFRYPEKDFSGYNATRALAEKAITLGKKYKVIEVYKDNSRLGKFLIQIIIDDGRTWRIRPECFETKPKRKLPEWW